MRYAVKYSYVTEGWVAVDADSKKEVTLERVMASDNFGEAETMLNCKIKKIVIQ